MSVNNSVTLAPTLQHFPVERPQRHQVTAKLLENSRIQYSKWHILATTCQDRQKGRNQHSCTAQETEKIAMIKINESQREKTYLLTYAQNI